MLLGHAAAARRVETNPWIVGVIIATSVAYRKDSNLNAFVTMKLCVAALPRSQDLKCVELVGAIDPSGAQDKTTDVCVLRLGRWSADEVS